MTRHEAVLYLRACLEHMPEVGDGRDAKRIQPVALAINALKQRKQATAQAITHDPESVTTFPSPLDSDPD